MFSTTNEATEKSRDERVRSIWRICSVGERPMAMPHDGGHHGQGRFSGHGKVLLEERPVRTGRAPQVLGEGRKHDQHPRLGADRAGAATPASTARVWFSTMPAVAVLRDAGHVVPTGVGPW